jgi:protein TonB
MIAKKNPRYDLERKRIVLFQIGLLTAGSFTLAAFTYRSPTETIYNKEKVSARSISFQVEEPKEIPKMEQPIVKLPPKKQEDKSSDPTINIQKSISSDIKTIDDQKKKAIGDVGLDGLDIKFDDKITTGDIVDVTGEVLDIVEKDAEYIGGYIAMMQFIQQNLNYPQEAIEMNEQGRVYVSFVIEKDGSVSNIQIERGVSKSIDREAERLVRMFPTWKPAEMAYGKVRARVRLPINFILE